MHTYFLKNKYYIIKMSTKSKRISGKIRKLIKEGYGRSQAIAIAYNYYDRGCLGPRGGLKRSCKKKGVNRCISKCRRKYSKRRPKSKSKKKSKKRKQSKKRRRKTRK